MNLKEILSISGKPGLYKLTAQSRGGVIVESLLDGKRFPVAASQNVSALGDIAIYTHTEEEPLANIFRAIFEKENGGEAPSHKADIKELMSYFGEIVPEFDRDRVYPSDIKKVFNWYNLLQKQGLVDLEVEAEESEEAAETHAEKEGN
jgi:hypothetical protein